MQICPSGHSLGSHLCSLSISLLPLWVHLISSFSYCRSLIRFNSPISKASKILLLDHFWLPFPLRVSDAQPECPSCLKSINVYPVINHVRSNDDHEPDDLLTPSMTIVASTWSQSLKSLVIESSSTHHYAISKFLMLLSVADQSLFFCFFVSLSTLLYFHLFTLFPCFPVTSILTLYPTNL